MPRDRAVVSKTMARVKAAHTAPELALRRMLSAQGLRYRLHDRRLPGAPDIVFPARKVAVFVDGDFWHGAQWKLRGFTSLESQLATMSNRAYWEKKLRRNIERDRRVNRALKATGWRVVRLLESAIKRHPARALGRVTRALAARGKGVS